MLERLIITLNDLAEKHGMSIDEIDNYIAEHKKIEQELDIDLITFYRIHKASVVFVPSTLLKVHIILNITNKGVEIEEIGKRKIYLPFSMYGITWALTEEELEK